VVVGGLPIVCASREALAARMVEDCLAARRTGLGAAKLIFAANGHSLSRAATDSEFRRHMEAADLIHADGQPLVFASRWLTGVRIPERSATTDFIHDAAKAAVRAGLRFYLLGATEDVNKRCFEVLQEMCPGLQIVGRRDGYFTHDEEAAVCDEINRAGPDVVWVGMGVPLEDAFCIRNKHRLQAGWLVTCGGCFNFVSGDYARAPGWMQAAGLEWLHRLACEPRRLFRRYLFTNTHALLLIVTRTPNARLPMRLAAAAWWGLFALLFSKFGVGWIQSSVTPLLDILE
jgi:N-acetylglucosaminyldiphosphoundecaprenol N-acetyl-beta-D-mannosaminyltransferase